jgi:hypothetical protein
MPPFMRINADAGKFAFLIPRISRAYALRSGAVCGNSAIAVQAASDQRASCRLRASRICVIYMPDKHSQFDASSAAAR